MKKNKNSVNVPLYASILGFIALVLIIVLGFVHSETVKTSKVTKSSTKTPTSSIKESSQKASSPSIVTADIDFSKWAKSYIFYYLKSGDAQASLIISPDGKVTQLQNYFDRRVFTGQASISSDNKNVLSYVINDSATATIPDKKTIKADVKIHVVWDNNGGTQDYYGYQTYTGQYALTDGIERAGGIDEVWVTKEERAMDILQIAMGNYGSVTGTWKNQNGDLLIFDNGHCTASAWKWSGNLIVGGIVPKGIVDNIAWASGNPDPRPGIGFMFAPAGISPNNIGGPDLTDTSKDRIVVCSNGGQTVFGESNSAYYKIN